MISYLFLAINWRVPTTVADNGTRNACRQPLWTSMNGIRCWETRWRHPGPPATSPEHQIRENGQNKLNDFCHVLGRFYGKNV